MYSRYLNHQAYPQAEKQQQTPPLSTAPQAANLSMFSRLQFDSSDLLVLFILLLTMQQEEQNTALLSAVLYFFM